MSHIIKAGVVTPVCTINLDDLELLVESYDHIHNDNSRIILS